MTQPNVKVKQLHPDAQLPRYAKPGDAGADLFAYETVTIPPMVMRQEPILNPEYPGNGQMTNIYWFDTEEEAQTIAAQMEDTYGMGACQVFPISDEQGGDNGFAPFLNVVAAGKALVLTGLAIELPPGYKAEIHSRSGLSLKKGIEVGAGLVDEGYRNQVGVVLFNFSAEPVTIEKGTAIAQLKIEKYEQATFEFVEELSETERGQGGFGSTDAADKAA